MKMNNMDKIIRQFLYLFGDRAIMYPCLDGDNIIATDGHIIVKVPVKYLQGEYLEIEKFPDWRRVIPEHDTNVSIGNLDTVLIDRAWRKLPHDILRDECEQCYGSGDVKCTCCGSEITCKECDGTGEGSKILDERINSDEQCCSINDVPFAWHYLHKMKLLSDELKQPIKACSIQNNKGCVFYVSDVMIVLMPLMQPFDENTSPIVEKMTFT